MRLVTSRLIIREYKPEDVADLVRNINNLNVSRYMAVIPFPYAVKDARWWIKQCAERNHEIPRTHYDLGIELKSEKRLIGGIGLEDVNMKNSTAELGYWLGEPYWRNGYMTEVLRAMLNFAFDKLKLRRIEIPTFVENLASTSLARKLGAKPEGIKRQAVKSLSTGKIHDTNIQGLLKKDYKK